jgi:UPF0716 protein FxsA
MALLVLLFVVVPIVELYVIIQVGEAIGVWWTLALLIADSIIGSLLMRSQGRVAWQRFQLALAEGRPPAREVLDGTLVIFGGAFLLTPGFVTDILGLVLLLPPTRAVVRRVIVARFLPSVVLRTAVRVAGGRPRPPRPRGAYDVEGTAVDVDRDALP